MGNKFMELSEKKCASPGCRRYLKQRIVLTNPDHKYCFKCSKQRKAKHYVSPEFPELAVNYSA